MKKIALSITVLFAFVLLSCSGKEIAGPVSETSIKPRELNFSYLDEDFKATESVTTTIAMTIKDEPKAEGFVMISKKNKNDEYGVYLTDQKNNTATSFFYKGESLFPHRINILKDGGAEIAIGDTTPHRKDTEDFDIIWTMDDEKESFAKIPLKNDIYSYNALPTLEKDANHQVKIISISTKIFAAINEHAENVRPTTRFWNKFWRIFLAVVTIIASAVLLVASILSFNVIGIAGGVVGIGLGIGLAVAPLVDGSDRANETVTKNTTVIIKDRHNPDKVILDGDEFDLTYYAGDPNNENSRLCLDIEVTKKTLDNFSITMRMENGGENAYATINSYFLFRLNAETEGALQPNAYIVAPQKFGNGNYIRLRNINNVSTNENRMFIHFETKDDHVTINGHLRKEFKIYVK